ncbi:polymerase delta-interacting protein 2-like isoform X2 [Mya arenaria]|uniref:polymerase delta-interacting protein 2-like isoform X2 n=1 Tax=Mya arenaria TaxID=6604 RepID=UPI0022E3331D|nr:polymerase delta-interacting protein 2-like isoform X2 [Mya arenaria]
MKTIYKRMLSYSCLNALMQRLNYSTRKLSYKWTELGVGEPVNPDTQIYPCGQVFMHKVLLYRGVIIQHWPALVHERLHTEVAKKPSKPVPYYQVLADENDLVHCKVDNPRVSFIPPRSLRKYLNKHMPVMEYPGIDYVSHEDIRPLLLSKKSKPLQHDLLETFFIRDDILAGPRFVRTEALQQFQDDLQPYLYMKDVYRHTTENVRVTVIPFYIGQDAQIHWWRYCVRIENLGEEMVQLRSRHWEIFSGSTREVLSDRGVVGKEPVLTTTYPVFQYMSTIPLESPTGTMWGFYTMERENGTTFECKIPTFKLEKYSDKHKTIVYPNTNDSTS